MSILRHLPHTHQFTVTKYTTWCPIRTIRSYVRYIAIGYVDLSSLYDENKLCLSYLQPKFTKVSTECVIDSRKKSIKRL